MKKTCCVIGGGFAGLAVGIALQEDPNFTVVIVDGDLPYEKASKIASGILQPFPGEHAKKALFADEAMNDAFELFNKVTQTTQDPFFSSNGIYRIAVKEKQEEEFLALSKKEELVYPFSEPFFPMKKWLKGIEIKNAGTIFSKKYLTTLENYFFAIGGKMEKRQIEDLIEVEPFYDFTIVAAGKNSAKLLNLSSLKFHKGQILKGHFEEPIFLEKSITGKGYLAITEEKGYYALGSTYEHHFTSDAPTEEGKEKILTQAKLYLEMDTFIVDEIFSSFRVTKKINHIPYVAQIRPSTFVITGFGSRGLLYHAYAAKMLYSKIANGIPIMKLFEDA
ncbi:MAG: FAD-binding oxidoreductase [Chlamydiae bacterium]|nr:FAD-binding oxidoreductase [Chlamydiota bacterium]